MGRVKFTESVMKLIQYIIEKGDRPIIDFVKRSTEEQNRLFKAGLSKCDGIAKISKHQTGMAVDIYLIGEDNKLINWGLEKKEQCYDYHRFWESLGGKKVIHWDLGHFEM